MVALKLTNAKSETVNSVASEASGVTTCLFWRGVRLKRSYAAGKYQPARPSCRSPFRTGCLFRSIKTRPGELRGCIGTIEPIKQNLAEELIANAINAATRDPRFDPVSTAELDGLRYSVDVLSAAEPADFSDLDPKTYGVIVEDESGKLRGLLLPDIAGVETARQQVDIAAQKAGIVPGATMKLSRFRVNRYPEKK